MLKSIMNMILYASITTTPCENLTNLELVDTEITSSELVPEGPPPLGGDDIPGHCRVQLELTPTTDSLIEMELWLPAENWNGKFMGAGNGLFGGSIQGIRFDMPEALRRGYATAGTDTGHQEEGGDWAIDHPEKMIDFAYRSTHEMTVKSKDIINSFYGGVKNSNGELIFSGQALGNSISASQYPEQGPGGAFDIVRIAFNDPDLDWREFDLDRDMPLIDEAIGYVDAVDTDLSEFKTSGGKLLMYHGWSDFAITPETTIWYYENVLDRMGINQSEWLRLFMVPGMSHCGFGPGVNTFDSIGALEKWVENGVAPDQILGIRADELTRPLCPYPQYSEYKGTGDLNNAENWTCKKGSFISINDKYAIPWLQLLLGDD